MRKAAVAVAEVLQTLRENVKEGVSTWDLNKMAEDIAERKSFKAAFKGYSNFPAAVCVALNDEVVHGKGSLIGKMPGDDWQKFANLRALFGYMYGHPGKKLIFMGSEFAQRNEWNHNSSLDWHLMQFKEHGGVQKWVRDLNYFYRNEPCLYEIDYSYDGFSWVDFSDSESSVISFIRTGKKKDQLLVVCNFTPATRLNYSLKLSQSGVWKESLNSDSTEYGGSGCVNPGSIETTKHEGSENSFLLTLNIPPLGITFLKPEKDNE